MILVCAQILSAVAEESALAHRWFYLSTNLLVEKNVKETEALMRRAKAAGYNGVLLADFKFNTLERVDAKYFENVRALKKTADELGFEIIPAVCPIGYGGGILAHDPNLAEGMPVRDALFVVKNGAANLVGDTPTTRP